MFDRNEEYDPRIDSIVRVEAGRLRAKIEEHYNGAGVDDPVLIRIPRGSYAPSFERRQRESAVATDPTNTDSRGQATRWRPAYSGLTAAILVAGMVVWLTGVSPGRARLAPAVTIAVLPFAHFSTDADDELLAARLTDGVTSDLARSGEFGVVSRTSALQFAGTGRTLREMARSLDADVVVEASVLIEGDRVRIQARLVNAAVDLKSWIQDFEGSRTNLEDLQHRVAGALATAATAAAQKRAPR